MYSRRLDGRVLSFGHEGVLYKKSFLQYDHQTRSLWAHVTGRCLVGALKGKRLEHFPSTVTTWADWKRRYPHTRVLAEEGRPNNFGIFLGMQPDQLDLYGLCFVQRGLAKAYPLPVLVEHPVVNDTFDETPILVVFSRRLRVANLWSRRVGQQLLRFSLVEENAADGPILQDAETGSRWRGLEGLAIAGPLEGTRLELLTHHPILSEAFRAFYPTGEIYSPAQTANE